MADSDPAVRHDVPETATAGRNPSAPRRRRRFRLDPRRDAWKILTVLGVLLLADLGFTFIVMRPQTRIVQQLESEKANFDLTYRQAKREAEAIEADYRLASEREEEYRVFYDTELSTSRRRLGLVQAEIWNIGSQFNTRPDPLNLTPKDLEDEGVQQLSISFPLDGGYENLRRFIDALERSEQLFIIERITMTENRAQSGGLRLSIDVSTFFNAPHQTRLLQESRKGEGRGNR